MSWAWEELRGTRLGDPRLELRLPRMVEDLAEHPEASCPEALGRAGAKAAYRFWDNSRVQVEDVLAGHAQETARRSMEYPVVLVAQDTTEINLTAHPATKGMGYLGSPDCRGYAHRWTIERFHFVLKSGCKIEQRQLETVERMERAIPVFSIVAWRLLWLALQARETPDTPCTVILEAFEWKVLCATARTRPLPTEPPTLREAVRMIAQLGGFLGRKCDGEPGPQTLWRGLRRLHDLGQGWLAAQQQNEVC